MLISIDYFKRFWFGVKTLLNGRENLKIVYKSVWNQFRCPQQPKRTHNGSNQDRYNQFWNVYMLIGTVSWALSCVCMCVRYDGGSRMCVWNVTNLLINRCNWVNEWYANERRFNGLLFLLQFPFTVRLHKPNGIISHFYGISSQKRMENKEFEGFSNRHLAWIGERAKSIYWI